MAVTPEDRVSFVPPPSIGHEIGVMFGFIGVFIVCFGVYFVVWQGYNKRGQRKEAERVRAVRAKEGLVADADEKTALRA